jgi:hypothetical protein
MMWAEEINTKWDKGREYQIQAVELMYAAMIEQSLNQKEVAKALGRSESWVSRNLKWRRNGYSETPNGPDARKLRKNCDDAISSRLTRPLMGQLDFFSEDIGFKPPEYEANLRARDTERLCAEIRRRADTLCSEVDLILASAPLAERHEGLAGFTANLNKTIASLTVLATRVYASDQLSSSPDKPSGEGLAPLLH